MNEAAGQNGDGTAGRRLILASLVVLVGLFAAGLGQPNNLTRVLLVLQDRWLLLFDCAVLLGLLIARQRIGAAGAGRLARIDRRAVWGLALLLVALTWAGHWLVLSGYNLSRDEQMADFDAWIFAHGHLAWPLPAVWRRDAAMLNLLFTPPVTHPVAWMSAYLPGNALLRALFGTLTGPLLSGAALLLVWQVARRLWPGDAATDGGFDRASAGVAVVLLALSGQLLFAGMSAYAMPAHLALNLGWLALFLKDSRRADLGAILIGALATGLHQPVFHPMFVAPFMALLLARRQWGRLALYGTAYAAIGLFWLAWPRWTLALVLGPDSVLDPQVAGYVSRMRWLLASNNDHLAMMGANLLRFVTWQHVLFLPLLLAGLTGARRDPLALALAGGLVLPLAFFALLMPFQGHGFGYRYLHGALGNAVLLAVMGWRRLARAEPRWHGWFVIASLASLVGALPLQARFAHDLYAPYALLSQRLSASGADYAVVGEGDAPLVLDLVANRPDLGNRPLRLVDGEIDDADLLAARICPGGHSVALPAGSFYQPVEALFGVAPTGEADARLAEQTKAFADAGCRVMVLR
ncbi:MAG: hypothetical protein JSS36_07255 [Proteobacteria bacterium]|nr:hypothetical protein [Pseudomonadota bacterium]